MPSPFPGMNPYLEQESVWQDFHDRMIPAISDALSPQVSPHFIVRIEEHLYIHEPPGEQRVRVGNADVSVIQPPRETQRHNGVALIESPERLVVSSVVDFDKQPFLEIRDRKNRDLIAVIELLSPTNKRSGADREQYLLKRLNLLHSQAHFVEIDLLRGWQRMPFEEELRSCDYCLLVSQVEQRPSGGVWRLKLRDRLPVIPIPLRPPVAEARLDLQEVLHAVYDRAFYKDYIYEESPQPPLEPADAAWAASILGN